MKITKIPTKQISPELSQINTSSGKDSTSSTIKQPTSTTRNFGWLVTGMVEACQQITIEDAIADR